MMWNILFAAKTARYMRDVAVIYLILSAKKEVKIQSKGRK